MERCSSYSLQRLPSTSGPTCRTPSKQSYAGFGPSTSGGGAYSNGGSSQSKTTMLTYALGLIACILLFMHTYQERHKHTNAALMGSRSWSENEVMSRGKQLEVQLVRKEQEIAALKTRLTQYISSNHMAESNMAAQDATIARLRLKSEAERASREKAEYALSERGAALEVCIGQQRLLENEVMSCNQDLHTLMSQAHAIRRREM